MTSFIRPLVFVREDSAPIRKALADMLEAIGARAFYPILSSSGAVRTTVMEDFRCALLCLDRKDPKDDPVDEAELFRTYNPILPIAFLNAGSDDGLCKRAQCIGPVFDKAFQLEAAVAWASQYIG